MKRSYFKANPNVDKQVNDANRSLFGCKSELTSEQKKSPFLEDVCEDPKKRGVKKGTKRTVKQSGHLSWYQSTTFGMPVYYV